MNKIAWNYDWLYKPSFVSQDTACDFETAGFSTVDLPHTNKILPYNYFDEKACQFVSCYKKIFTPEDAWAGKTILAQFEGVMLACNIYLNGTQVGSHEGGFTPFQVDLTPALKMGEENVLVVEVDSTERSDIPPFGNVVDYITYGGIYREISLCVADPVRIDRLWIDSTHTLEEKKDLQVRCEVTAGEETTGELTVTLTDSQGNTVAQKTVPTTFAAGTAQYPVDLTGLTGIQLWDTQNPVLYTVTAELNSAAGKDSCQDRYGFRTVRFAPDGFYLNEKKVKLIGLNRHQAWPYVGYAMPERIQRKDAEIIRRDMNCNIVRTSHYPQSRHFLDACDELGLLVMEEIPGWQHIGGEVWKDHAVQDVRDMITRDYNRPAIALWGVRINESQDDHDFYVRTNAAAREMDNTRQTGGTRYIQKSELLEDIYTYNDFTHDGGEAVFRPQEETTGLDKKVPLLVTESNGHMFPTKRFDQEQRLSEHALRHLRVINEALLREDMAGGISWCAFDYHTHSSFGSGDKICYHGVCDMYRNPKFAAYSYASQKDPKDGIVLEPVTLGSRGERDRGGMVPFQVLTNCDFVRVYKNDSLVGDFYPDRKQFTALAHPPVQIWHLMEADLNLGFSKEDHEAFMSFMEDAMLHRGLTALGPDDFAFIGKLAYKYQLDPKTLIGTIIRSAGGWGDTENNLRLEGWLDGKRVCVKAIGESKWAAGLEMTADDSVLHVGGNTYDATRVTIRALDNMGNLMPYIQECVELKLEGPAQIMGPTKFPLVGGISSFWIRTTGENGEVRITADGMTGSAECSIQIQ